MTIVYACRHVSRQGPVEPVVLRRMRCPRCRGKKKEPRAVTTIFLSLLCLLALATSASAECAWVLWRKDPNPASTRPGGLTGQWSIVEAYTGLPSMESMVAKGGCDKRKKELELALPEKSRTEFLCLPDTIDPRGPKGK
jgi:hypothetical protein